MLEIGAERARNFGAMIEKARVIKIFKKDYFGVYAGKNKFLSKICNSEIASGHSPRNDSVKKCYTSQE